MACHVNAHTPVWKNFSNLLLYFNAVQHTCRFLQFYHSRVCFQTLFGGGSPRTIVADTACEVVVLHRSDIDNVLASFPVLKMQMDVTEGNARYKEDLLQAIRDHEFNIRLGQVLQTFNVYEM